ncbi:hypothetical protein EVG20_g8275 [Dentipellis fragilis]|uniref:Uncharacterized protein n=1 Tax=Dentipellis fragilis TaxID=205917 RepID=A0A4Y9Y6I6_9AGAM|nr:hypothetical protein EVG20_g8275 [Dentipellis fragilis]
MQPSLTQRRSRHRGLTILHRTINSTGPIHAILPALAGVLRNATSLTSLCIPIWADDLLNMCPELVAYTPPSWRLDLGGLYRPTSSWLTERPLKGLHTLSLNFSFTKRITLQVLEPSARSSFAFHSAAKANTCRSKLRHPMSMTLCSSRSYARSLWPRWPQACPRSRTTFRMCDL